MRFAGKIGRNNCIIKQKQGKSKILYCLEWEIWGRRYRRILKDVIIQYKRNTIFQAVQDKKMEVSDVLEQVYIALKRL